MSTNRFRPKEDSKNNFTKKPVSEQKKISRENAQDSSEKPNNENIAIESAKKLDDKRGV